MEDSCIFPRGFVGYFGPRSTKGSMVFGNKRKLSFPYLTKKKDLSMSLISFMSNKVIVSRVQCSRLSRAI